MGAIPWAQFGGIAGGIGALVSAYIAYQNHRLRGITSKNHEQLSGWKTLSEEWRAEIAICHRERDQLRIEVSSLRTLVIALRKIHEGEYPSLPELQKELQANGGGNPTV